MSEIRVDTISEKTSANGVAIDSVTLKDGGIAATAASTITTADNLDTLSLVSTDADATVGPNLRLYRNSSSPADSDDIGAIRFDMRNDNSQDFTAFQITGDCSDVSDGTEDAEVHFDIMTAGTLREYLRMASGSTPSVIINEDSQDIDFRVESNGNANMLFVDGGNDRVGVGTASPTELLHLKTSNAETSLNIEGGANQSGSLYGSIEFKNTYGGASADTVAKISGIRDNDQTASHLAFYSKPYNGSINERLRLHSGGVLSASQGIALGVGTANTASNVLDDYEEGTYDVTMTVNSGSLTPSGSSNALAYTKIGRVVHVQGEIRFSAISSPSGAFSISLPFAVADLADGAARFTSGAIGQSSFVGTPNQTYYFRNTNEGTTGIGVSTHNSGSDINVNANQVNTNTEMIVSFTFVAA